MKNKESRLEKKSVWKTAIPYVPFAGMFSERRMNWRSSGLGEAKVKYNSIENIGYSLGEIHSALAACALVFTPFLTLGNYCEKTKIKEQVRIQKNQTSESFNKYDLNKDGVLSSEEFLNYYKEKK